jgi:isoprenylcysteine carboxyl methyltransferase (ICMT) family protein YpbQ
MIIISFVLILIARFYTVIISARNEIMLKEKGAIEFGGLNTLILISCHFLYYGACITEGLNKAITGKDPLSWLGIFLYALSIIILYGVIRQISYVWTIKLLIAPKSIHIINRSFLFKYFRHPNYYLSIIPEMIGIAMIFHSWYVLAIGLPVYLIPLIIRIIQEERIMKFMFDDYK